MNRQQMQAELEKVQRELDRISAQETLSEDDLHRAGNLTNRARSLADGGSFAEGWRPAEWHTTSRRTADGKSEILPYYGGAPAFHRNRTADRADDIACRYIVTGDPMAGQEMHAAAVDELRASNDSSWNIATSADGGYAVPTGHYARIIARRDEAMLAPRLGVRPIPGVGTTVNVAVDAESDGEFVVTAEQDDAHSNNYDRDQAALGTVAMTLVKRTKKLEITEELLQDSLGLMPFIEDWVGRAFAKTHNSMLIAECLANATAALTFDSSNALTALEVPELAYLLPEEYEDNASWVMRRGTESIIRQKVGDAWHFAPTPAGTDRGARRDLWGYPLYTSQYMGAVEASGKSILFGDFSFVGLREMPSFSLIRDPFSVDGMLVLKYSFRATYKVLQAPALVFGSHPTS